MFSREELHAAWDRVRENQGCAGVDGLTVVRFATDADRRLDRLRQSLVVGSYRPLPLLEILVRKAPDSPKIRRLLVPTVPDRILHTAAARLLSPSLEDEFLEASFAYRPGRGVDMAVARVLQLRDRGYCWVLDADIVQLFDHVDHALLRRILAAESMEPWLRSLVDSWIGGEIWNGMRLTRLYRGVPQGSPLSPLLANLFLHDLDATLSRGDLHIVRYADDFLVLCPGQPEAEAAWNLVAEWLAAHKLRFHPDKTHITQFKEGFRFLGVQFTQEDALVPWKSKAKAAGQVLRMAKPMPAHLLYRYRCPAPKSAMRMALEAGGAVQAAPPPANEPERKMSRVAFLYLVQQGAVLRKSGERFLVEKDDRIWLDLPANKLECVLVFGNVQVTTQALGELMEQRIPVAFLTRQGRLRGTIHAPGGKDIPLRIAQFRACTDRAVAQRLAADVLRAKLRNCEETVHSFELRQPPEQPAGTPLPVRLAGAEAAADGQLPLEQLLGFEGAAAREYFERLMRFNRSPFVWQGRRKYPAPDPLNAMLSLAYTLLMAELTGALDGHGLDAYLGFLHQPDYGRVSLSLDLMEPFRGPVCDRFVLRVVNLRIIQPGDFGGVAQEPPAEAGNELENRAAAASKPVYLLPEALTRFVAAWEQWMCAEPKPRDENPPAKSFRRELRREVEKLVRHWRGELATFDPWTWDRRQTPEEEICDSLSATT